MLPVKRQSVKVPELASPAKPPRLEPRPLRPLKVTRICTSDTQFSKAAWVLSAMTPPTIMSDFTS